MMTLTRPKGRSILSLTSRTLAHDPAPQQFNTHSLVISEMGSGIVISDDSLYPSLGAGVDTPISFELVFKPTLLANLAYIVRMEDDSGLKIALTHEYNGSLRIDLQSSAGNRLSGKTSGGVISIDNWYHVIFTYSGNKNLSGLKIYTFDTYYTSLSGSNSQGSYAGLPSLDGSFEVKIPVTPATAANKFIGKINLFRIFNKELTQEEARTLLEFKGPIDIEDSVLKNSCVLEHRFNDSLKSHIGKDATAVGELIYDTDIHPTASIPNQQLDFTPTALDSLYWPQIYKSSDWIEFSTTKPYFTIYSSDHSTTGGGVAWGECDDMFGNGFIERGLIVSGNQAETPWLVRVPSSISGITEEVFLYYHTSSGESGNDGKQQTRLITTSGGAALHLCEFTDRGRPLGIFNDDVHTGYCRVRINSNNKLIAQHLTVGGSNPKFYTSISNDGLMFTRLINTTSLLVDGMNYFKNEISVFMWNGNVYGFIGIRFGGLTKIGIAKLDDNFLPESIVLESIDNKYYDIRAMTVNIEENIAYIKFKGGSNTYRFEPYYILQYNLNEINNLI